MRLQVSPGLLYNMVSIKGSLADITDSSFTQFYCAFDLFKALFLIMKHWLSFSVCFSSFHRCATINEKPPYYADVGLVFLFYMYFQHRIPHMFYIRSRFCIWLVKGSTFRLISLSPGEFG